MSLYHLIRDGQIVASREFGDDETAPTLAPNKGEWVPEVIQGETYDPVTEVREAPVQTIEAGRVVIAYPVRAKGKAEIDGLRAQKVAAIKAEAERRILAIMPAWKQCNYLALGLEMTTTHGADPKGWPPEFQAEYAVASDLWSQIKAIRTRSDEIEAALPSDLAKLDALDPVEGWD